VRVTILRRATKLALRKVQTAAFDLSENVAKPRGAAPFGRAAKPWDLLSGDALLFASKSPDKKQRQQPSSGHR